MHLGFLQRTADVDAFGGQEGVGHGAADHQEIHFGDEVAEQVELGGNLGAANDRHHRAHRVAEGCGQRFQLGLHQPPGVGRQQMRHALGAGMGAVGGGERVVDEDVGEFGEFGGKGGVVLFLAGVEAGVFQHRDIAGGQAFDHLRGQRHLSDALALRTVEMAEHDHPRPLVRQLADGGRQAFDPGEISDPPVPDGHIEVGAHENAFAGNVEPVEGTDGHDQRLPSSAAVSDIRLEKPHSLSYQLITRTRPPSTTAVWVASKVDEKATWLKSELTRGAVL